MVDTGFDVAGHAHEQRLDDAVKCIRRLAETDCHDDVAAATLESSDSVAPAREQTVSAIYECAADIRLELIYCPTLSGHLRKRWSHRLGDINLRAASAAAEIHNLRDDLAAYEAACDTGLAADVAEIRGRLRQLRELCLRAWRS